jgi:hypothetical protein
MMFKLLRHIVHDSEYEQVQNELTEARSVISEFREGVLNQAKTDEANLRTEYSAICSNLNQLASFRFTLVGFYVAAIGLIASGGLGNDKFILLLWISLCFWILELRNRGLHSNMAERGAQIEREYWGYRGKRAYEPFISHWSRKEPQDDKNAGNPPARDKVSVLSFDLRLPVSHTAGLDLLFVGVIVYSVIRIFNP